MSRKKKKTKRKDEDNELLEKLDTQNKALKKIISVLKGNNNSKNQSKKQENGKR